ncbi:retrovirus-related pol polyprotein from transposon TNT 1-94 [Tanacetum coccineum]|uniref:Retrovirus-related pol polyprotein from transposon TNT 1-94 n=1 Tax=Tanacetum coccineum TaxID=301880 RepID=A0ABQ5IST6_9ASTR
MSNTNTNFQTQTSNALHNSIMEVGGKDRPPMLAPGESINVQDLETNLYWEFGKFTSRDGELLESYYSRSQPATTRIRGKAIINSPLLTYDQEPEMVAKDDEMSKEKEIDKLMALISLLFKKIYKPTYNNLRTSSNTSRANQDNTPRINRGTRYDNQRIVNVVGARENVEEARFQLKSEQADWKEDTDDEPNEQELEAHCMYMAQIQEVTLDAADNSGPIFDTELMQKLIEIIIHRRLWVLKAHDGKSQAPKKYYYANHMNAILGVYTTLDESTDLQCEYVDKVVKCERLEKELSKKQIKNDKAFKENHSNAFLKEHEQYFEIQDLKAQLQDKNIALCELKKIYEKMKGKSVETKFEKSSVIRQPNAFKSQRQSVLGKPATFSDSLAKTDFSKSKPVTTNNVSNDFSKPVTTHILPQNVMPILKNTNVIAPGMYKVHTRPNQTRTPQLPQDIRKTNKRVSFSTRVIPTTSVSRPQLKSNQLEDRVMPNNSQGKKQKVEDHPRRDNSIHRRLWVLKAHDGKISATKSNFVEKFLGTVKFGNDQIASILGYGDLVQGNITIKRVYYVEGLNHNLFSVGQFCDADLEVAFRKSTCYIRDLKGNDLLTGSRGTDLYSITLQDTSTPNPICLMAKATSSQAWLWHRRLSHLNFDSINLLSKNDIVIGLPKLKFIKDHLCSSCELGKAKRKSFHTKTTPSSKRRLQLLHMDLCGPMRVESINGKKYVLVIVDDYSRYTWTHFLRSKDETPEVLIDFLRLVQRGLHAQVRTVRTDKGT